MTDPKNTFSEEYFKQKLTPEQYRIMREAGTEMAFTGEYVDNHQEGMYACAACGQELFPSGTKFESGTGWPSFYDVARAGTVTLIPDTAHGMERVEVRCSKCGSHLGHVFNDGPADTTGKRYCINSACLMFQEKKKE